MPRYRFPLEPVLKERRIRQDQAQMALSSQERTVQGLEDRLAEVKRLLQEGVRRCAQEQASGSSGSALRLYHLYLERLQAEGQRLLHRFRNEAETLRSLRLVLQEQFKKRWVVERLKEKGYRRFLEELRAQDQKGLDEAAGIFHYRKRETGG